MLELYEKCVKNEKKSFSKEETCDTDQGETKNYAIYFFPGIFRFI